MTAGVRLTCRRRILGSTTALKGRSHRQTCACMWLTVLCYRTLVSTTCTTNKNTHTCTCCSDTQSQNTHTHMHIHAHAVVTHNHKTHTHTHAHAVVTHNHKTHTEHRNTSTYMYTENTRTHTHTPPSLPHLLLLSLLIRADGTDILLPFSFHPLSMSHGDTDTVAMVPLLTVVTTNHESV